MKRLIKRAAAALLAAGAAASFMLPASLSASAKWQRVGYVGDLNSDDKFSVADLVILTKYVLGAEGMPETGIYDMQGAYYLTGVRDEISSLGQDAIKNGVKQFQLADMDEDGVIDTFDLAALRKVVVDPNNAKLLYRWYADEVEPPDYIDAPIYDLYGSMPSQGDAKVVAFSVEFPDLKFGYKASTDEVEQALFAPADENSKLFPLESISAFYERSSKGAMHLSGKAYDYTAKYPISNYEGDKFHLAIINEVLEAFDEQIDFSEYDADGDSMIDTVMIIVPSTADDGSWWPTSGGYGGSSKLKFDGCKIGHVIVGNRNIEAKNNYAAFCQTYSHEMGHCMGLPDYYLYDADDFQGMHGSAGFELMDDAFGDFGAASKLMLGWYREDQISVFDRSAGEQTFTLYNSETDLGNCVIIPRGTLGDKYRSEFFIIEYTTLDNNNLRIRDKWWKKVGEGVRVYHVQASQNGDRTFPSWKYASGNDTETNYNKGIRFIRLVNEGDDNTDNFFRGGSVVNSSVSGFMWYDDSSRLTVSPETAIYVTEGENGTYNVRIAAE